MQVAEKTMKNDAGKHSSDPPRPSSSLRAVCADRLHVFTYACVFAENTHLVNIGTMVQDMENKMLSQMKEVDFGKTQETTKRLRYLDGGASRQAGAMLRQAFMEAAGDK
jgi:hypothetical protein